MATDEPRPLQQRKIDHLDICANEDVEARRKTTLLEEVELIHQSLPELSLSDVDTSTTVLKKRLAAPLVITGMTGGVERAVAINRCLAGAAERHGIAFGLGSQRPMLDGSTEHAGYLVRDVAPTALILGNLGAVQAAALPTARVAELVERVGADALAIHLNPAQELIQAEGDRDFRGCVDAIRRLNEELDVPVIVKETGAGLGPSALERLRRTGVRWIDVSGAGGTTWVGVETLRDDQSDRRAIGGNLWDWGTPTAVATISAVGDGFEVIASGGLRTGLDCALALALGARAAGMALPYLRAYAEGGEAAVDRVITRIIETIRCVMLLTGSRDLLALRSAPRVYGPTLRNWLEQLEAGG